MKKFIAVILALCTALSLLAVSAFADNEKQYVVAGNVPGSDWQVDNENFLMTYNPDLGIYTFAIALVEVGTYEFKVFSFGSYDEAYNFDGSSLGLGTNATVTVYEDGSTVIFTFDKSKAGVLVVPPGARDTEAPVFKNIEDGKTYCTDSAVGFAVTDNKEVKSVTVNGTPVTPVDGMYYIDAGAGTVTVVASDAQSNSSSVTITVNEHNYKLGECTECGAKDPDICGLFGFIFDFIRWIIRIVKDFVVWAKDLPAAFIAMFR